MASRSYSLVGALLGLGAPLGFLALERALQGRRPGRGVALGYMAVATPIVFGLFGRALGRKEERRRAAAARLGHLRDELAAVVAHDLRNPINSMLLQLQMLLRKAKDGEARVPVTRLEQLLRAGEQLARLTRDLLDATRIEAARLSVYPQPLALPEAVSALVDGIRPTLGAHAVEVRAEGGPLRVEADPIRLDQILTNLIVNAARYSPEGAPIQVRVRPDGEGVRISVIDRGPGIAPEEQARLWDRFYQATRARAEGHGLGLGLYIAKGLALAHGGRIWVESEPGRGSTFHVWLPRGGAALTAPRAGAPRRARRGNGAPPRSA